MQYFYNICASKSLTCYLFACLFFSCPLRMFLSGFHRIFFHTFVRCSGNILLATNYTEQRMFTRSTSSVRRLGSVLLAPTFSRAASILAMPPSNFAAAEAPVDKLAQMRLVRGSLGHAESSFPFRYNALTSKRWNTSGAPNGAGAAGGEKMTTIASGTPLPTPTSLGTTDGTIAGNVGGDGISALSDAATGAAAEVVSKAADLGINPVDIVIMTLNEIQTVLGIPYWEAIVLFTVALRLCLLPVAIKGVVNANRMAFLRPDMERLQEAMKASQALGDMKVQQRYQMEMKGLFEKHKVNPLRALVLPFLQMPIFVSVFMALRQVQDYFPAYCSGGALWFTDLSMSDPYYILPVINAATFLLMIETGADGMDQNMKGTFKNVMRVLGVAMVPLTASMPQGLFMYWCTNNVLSLLQARAMKSGALKKAFDLKDPPASAKVDRESAFKKISSAMAEFSEQMKKEQSGQVEIITGSKESVSPPPPPSSADKIDTSGSNSGAGAPPKTFAHNPKQVKRSK